MAASTSKLSVLRNHYETRPNKTNFTYSTRRLRMLENTPINGKHWMTAI